MGVEEALEAIKRHVEAIENIVKGSNVSTLKLTIDKNGFFHTEFWGLLDDTFWYFYVKDKDREWAKGKAKRL